MSEPYMKWQDELCGLCKHSHQSHGATDGGRCRVRGCLCSKFNEVIERDQAIHELETVIETLRARNRDLLAALEAAEESFNHLWKLDMEELRKKPAHAMAEAVYRFFGVYRNVVTDAIAAAKGETNG